MAIYNVVGSYKYTFATGAVTTIAAATATAGHILALRNATSAARTYRLRTLEVEFMLTTAFGAAQEVGFDVSVARTYTAAHTGETALTMTGGRMLGTDANPLTLAGRISSTAALTAGTHTFDANPIARASVWCAAIGASFNRFYDYTNTVNGGVLLGADTGIVARNSILMGATGVGRWLFTAEIDEGVLG